MKWRYPKQVFFTCVVLMPCAAPLQNSTATAVKNTHMRTHKVTMRHQSSEPNGTALLRLHEKPTHNTHLTTM